MKTDGGFNKLSDNSRLLIVTLSPQPSINSQQCSESSLPNPISSDPSGLGICTDQEAIRQAHLQWIRDFKFNDLQDLELPRSGSDLQTTDENQGTNIFNCTYKDQWIVRKSRKEMQVKVLSWILISIIDGLVGYILLKGFNRVIGGDLNGYFKRIEIDEFFMLKPGILEKLSKDENKSMRNLQLISPIVNLPYLFSKDPLDGLIISNHTKLENC
ncbi:hypothetical protein BY996DRAFT_6565428 [Phakopsora pachyrhizi]|nr:hypothetical protein BY996DRAFT_6565428 [Phakopsora pachyrhizi]